MTCQPGDRIRLDLMPNDPCPIESGATGTVTHVTDTRGMFKDSSAQIWVEWDNGRSLMLLEGVDQYTVTEGAQSHR